MKRYILILILIAAAIVRFSYLASIWDTSIVKIPIIDSEYYHQWAARIADGRGGEEGIFFMSPLYPYLLSFFYRIFGPFPQVGLFFQALAGIALVYLMFRLGKALFNENVGLLSAALAAFYRPFVYYEGVLLTSTLILLLNAFILLMLLSKSQKIRVYLILGGLLGLSTLGRPSILLFATMLMIYFLWKPPELGRKSAVFLILGILIILLPVAYRNYHVGGEWVFSTAGTGMNFYAGNNAESQGIYWEAPFIRSAEPQFENQDYRLEASALAGHDLSIAATSQFWFKQGLSYVLHQPISYLRLLLTKFFLFFHATEIPNNLSMYAAMEFSKLLRLLPFTFGLLAPIGFGFWLLNLRKPGFSIFNLYGLSYLLITLIFFAASEYRLPILLLLIPCAAAGVIQLIDYLKKGSYRSLAMLMFTSISLAVAVNMSTPMTTNLTSPRMDYFNLGSVLQKCQRDEEAIPLLQKALIYDPSFAEAHRALGESYHLMGMHEEAAEEFRRAGLNPKHELDMFDGENLLAEAQKNAQQGNLKEALKFYQQAISIHPEPPAYAFFNIAYLEMQSGDTTRAIDYLNQAADVDPREPRIPYVLGQVLEKQGNDQRALEKYLAALDMNENFDLARAHSASLAMKLGDKKQAARLIEPILGLKFTDPELVGLIEQVAGQVGY
ncbi:MAG: tetratricopeptide repeat protein [bacterium]|nr:tetratricopeptide repeat protein [bacterium]